MQKQYHIAVIGGGASGLLAAIAAKIEGGADCSVVILERNDRIGRKILSTGNGRCNLGNTVIQKENYSGSLLEKAFAIFQQAPKTEDHRLYPHCNHASAVLDSLRLQVELYGIAVQCDCQIQNLIPKKHGFLLQSDTESYFAEQVIFACGGYAAPALGTDGSAYAMLKDLKIAIRPCTPALCFLKTKTELVRALKGIRLLAKVSLYENGVLKRQERGEVQFTEQALSGICICNLSAYCDKLSHATYTVALDLLPDWDLEQVYAFLWELYALRGTLPIEEFFIGIFQRRVGLQILKQYGILQKEPRLIASCTPKEIKQLASFLKAWKFPVIGKGDWKNAQISCGGIISEEVSADLESIRYPGLYFSGEALDLQGDCGGYNLNWAWASGWWTGTHAAKEWKQKHD